MTSERNLENGEGGDCRRRSGFMIWRALGEGLAAHAKWAHEFEANFQGERAGLRN